ncbi:MAG: hybrid sensor histidine kinase/response regulator, partial [Proteobacteria bacterium]|nr:hybrid sensor histidine kinase/response regulator [Pseudomonadota bacterium]
MSKAPRKIVAVDDDASILLILSELLESSSYELLTATSALEALTLLEHVDASLIITDQLMTEMKGSEFCRILRKQRKFDLVPIIALTSTEQSEVIREIYASGANDYVRKSFIMDELLPRVEQNIRNHIRDQALNLSNLELQKAIAEHHSTSMALQKSLEQTTQALAVKKRFLANMSHELRTPLNGILGFTQLALEEVRGTQLGEDLTLVRDASQAMISQINDLLTLSQLESGSVHLEKTPIDVADILEDVRKFFEIRCAIEGKILVVAPNPKIPKALLGDPLRLRQVFVSLVSNAVKFTGDRGVIVVFVDAVSNSDGICTLECAVNDNGIGIKPEAIRDLFEPFAQSNSSSTREHGGTGIGLSIARRLIQAMHGDIEAHSIPGVGSSFRFSMKLHTTFTLYPPSSRNQTEKQSVLVVGDYPRNREGILTLLDQLGLPFLVVQDGKQAITTLTTEPVSLVLMDCQLPALDGFE